MANNPFEDLIPQQQQASPQEPPAQNDAFADLVPPQQDAAVQSNNGNAFMAAVEGFNRSFGRTAEGVLQVAAKVLPEGVQNAIKEQHDRLEARYAQTQANHPIASAVGETTGYIGQGVAIPIAKSSLVARVGSLALGGAALGAAQYGTGEERFQRGVEYGLVGAGAGLLGEAVGAGYKALVKPSENLEPGFLSKMITPRRAAAQEIAQQIEGEGGLAAIQSRGTAAQNLGANLTPGQMSGSEAIRAAEKRIPITDELMRTQASTFVREETGKLKTAVNNIVDGIIPEGDNVARAQQTKMYNNLAALRVDPKIQNNLLSNPVISSELESMANNKLVTKAVADLPNDSVLKLDKIKQEIDRQLYKDVSVSGNAERTMGVETRRALQEARSEIVNNLDAQFPEYAATRKLSERIVLKQDILHDLSTISPKAGKLPNELTLDQMYSKLWGTPEKQENFLNRIGSAGGDTENVQNVITVLNQVRNSPIAGMVKKGTTEDTANVFGSLSYRVASFVQKLTAGKYNKEYLNLITNSDEWQSEVSKVLESKTPNTFVMGFKNLLDKVKKGTYNFFDKTVPGVVSKPKYEDVNVKKMSMEPRPRMNPKDYMGAEMRAAQAEEANAQAYHIHPSKSELNAEGYLGSSLSSPISSTVYGQTPSS